MGWYTKLKVRKADEAIQAAQVSQEKFCYTTRKDASGNEMRTFPKLKNGHQPPPALYGYHGTDYFEIDPDTLEVRCGACEGDLDSTVRE